MRILLAFLLVICGITVLKGATRTAVSTSRADVGAAYALCVEGDILAIPAGISSWTNSLTITTPITVQGAGIGNTVFLDDIIATGSGPEQTQAILYVNTTSNKFYRVTGIEFRNGTRATALFAGSLQVTGDSTLVRVDHCKFNQLNNAGLYVRGAVYGVCDHCEFNQTLRHFIAFRQNRLYGKTGGDGSYETPVVWGSGDNFFVENCTINGDDSDAFGGSRYVFRFNTGANWKIHSHGTESSGRFRSQRSCEVYGNTGVATASTTPFIDFRGGSGIVCSNTITGPYSLSSKLDVYRAWASFPIWFGADGTNAWDHNIGLQDSGTVTSAASLQMTDTTKTWTVNQWAGMEIKNLSSNRFSRINSNTSNTLVFESSNGLNGGNMQFAAGNSYRIYKVDAMLDQPGRGLCGPINTSAPAWPNQQVDTIYQWANTFNASPWVMTSAYGSVQEGREFTNNVAYPGYTPYTYPHPLVTGNAATQVAFAQQPTTTTKNTSIFPAITVQIRDANGVLVATNSTVSIAIGTNPGGGTLSGTTSVAASNGTATFSNLSINNPGNGYTLVASSAGLTSATSTSFNITSPALPPTKLAFGQQPTTTDAGVTITPAVTVLIQDANGNLVSTNFTVTIAIGTNPGGSALSGILSVVAVAGVATFNNLSLNNAGTGYTLVASSSGLTSATSSSFSITSPVLPPTKLAFGQQPITTQVAAIMDPPITVLIQDATGALVNTNLGIIIAIGTNPGGGTLSGTLIVPAVAGIATFSDLSIDNAGIGYTLTADTAGLISDTSQEFDITAVPPAPPSKIVFGQPPTSTQVATTITPAVTVLIQDASGNLISTNFNVTLAIGTNPSGGILSGTLTVAASGGIATFSDLSIDQVGAGYTLTATCGSLTGATSGTFNITAAPPPPAVPVKVVFNQQPTTTRTNAFIRPDITVLIQDISGNTVSTNLTVTMAIAANPGGGMLSGTLSQAAVAGVATFSNLSINAVGTNYTLQATSPGLTSATSNPFNITKPIPPAARAPVGLNKKTILLGQ